MLWRCMEVYNTIHLFRHTQWVGHGCVEDAIQLKQSGCGGNMLKHLPNGFNLWIFQTTQIVVVCFYRCWVPSPNNAKKM